MKLYYHKTDGGAEYLTDKFIKWKCNGKSGKEGVFEGANYIVRIDGDITKDAELSIKNELYAAAPELLEACKIAMAIISLHYPANTSCCNDRINQVRQAIAKAEGN
ncbi:MAG: hypothetical protein WC373_04665 [Smithella sp.]|jgi:hypothetical protein